MGWFDQQIKQRKLSDQEVLEDSFMEVASVILGNNIARRLNNEITVSKHAIDDILKYYHYKPVDIKDGIDSFDEALEYILRPYGIMYRNIKLDEKWYTQAYGPILGFTNDKEVPVALLPRLFSSYYYNDPETGHRININAETAKNIKDEAICFYRPLPLKKLGLLY